MKISLMHSTIKKSSATVLNCREKKQQHSNNNNFERKELNSLCINNSCVHFVALSVHPLTAEGRCYFIHDCKNEEIYNFSVRCSNAVL